MLELKKSLSQESFTQMMHALQAYKATDNLDDLVAKAADLLIQDLNTHILLRGMCVCVCACENVAIDTDSTSQEHHIVDISNTVSNLN